MSERENQAGNGEVAACHVCGKIFDSQELLVEHLLSDHPDED